METTVDVSRLNKKAADLVRLATDIGWLGRTTTAGTVILTSPIDTSIVVQVSTSRSLNENKLRSMTEKVKRYSDPVRYAAMMGAMTAGKSKGPNGSTLIKTDSNLIRSLIMDDPGALEMNEDSEELKTLGDRVYNLPRIDGEKAVSIVSTRPHLAKLSTNEKSGRAYPSGAVLERTWTDGSTDYACSWPGCSYENAVPLSVAKHYAASPTHGRAKAGQSIATPPYESRTQSRIDRLAKEIEDAMSAIALDVTIGIADPRDGTDGSMVKAIAAKIIELRDRRKATLTDPEDGEPLTPEQLIEKIRRIVDDGSYFARLTAEAAMQEQIAALQAQNERTETNLGALASTLETAQQELAAASARAQQAEDRWTALKQLVDGE